MSLTKADLILHPVRLRILQSLIGETLTTQQISNRLDDVPTSSIYRHLKLLLDEGMVNIAEMRLVNGIQEKTYTLAQRPLVSAEDMASTTVADHWRYFTMYTMALLQDFQQYLKRQEVMGQPLDFLADQVGYTEVAFYATNEELVELGQSMNEALLKLLGNKPGEGRHRHKMALITHPVQEG